LTFIITARKRIFSVMAALLPPRLNINSHYSWRRTAACSPIVTAISIFRNRKKAQEELSTGRNSKSITALH